MGGIYSLLCFYVMDTNRVKMRIPKRLPIKNRLKMKPLEKGKLESEIPLKVKTPEQVQRDYDDYTYWKNLFEKLKMNVRGWTKRESAVAIDDNKVQHYFTR